MGRKRLGRHPAHHAVAARATPDLVALTVEEVEYFAMQKLIDTDRVWRRAVEDVRHARAAIHDLGCCVAPGAHQSLQRQFGEVGPGQGGPGVEEGGVCGQTWARPVEVPSYAPNPKVPLTAAP